MIRTHQLPTDVHFDEVKRAVEVTAAGYARRLWWVDRADLENQGWLFAAEILNKQGTYDPSVGVPLFSYLKSALSRLVYNYVYAQSAPVSAPRRNAAKLRGLQRAPLEEAPEDTLDPEHELKGLFSSDERRRRLETTLYALVGEETAERAIPYLIREEKEYPAAAARAGCSVAEVKEAVKVTRKAIANSPELWRLWAG